MKRRRGHYRPDNPADTVRFERGQTTIAMAAVLAFAVVLAGALASVAGAMVHRHRAQAAADAVALAAVTDSAAADRLVAWYGERSILVERSASRATASSGPAQAQAWAERSDDVLAVPALVAIIARAEQLLGHELVSARVIDDRVELNRADGSHLGLVAVELGLCEQGSGSTAGPTTFGLC